MTHAAPAVLDAAALLAGAAVVHDVVVPAEVLNPAGWTLAGPNLAGPDDAAAGVVRIRPVTVSTLMLVSRAARDDPGLAPVLLVKEALVEPRLTLDQVRGLHVGLLHFLVQAVNSVSGLAPDGDVLHAAGGSALARTHQLLARHFGWTPDQVAALTPGQLALYLSGLEQPQAQGVAS